MFIGFLIGSLRMNTFLVNSFFGHIGDRFNPRTVLILCELGAALGSVLILITWKNWSTNWMIPFAIANNIRVFFTALQAGSIQKLGKNFDTHLDLKGRFAVRMSGVTNGALLFGGLVAILFFEHITVERLVIFDAITFAINGLIILLAQKKGDHEVSQTQSKKGVSLNFVAYYKALPFLAILDVLLSLALTGSNTLNIRLLENNPQLVPLMPTLFGAVAFICSFGLDKKFHASSKVLWVALSLSLLAQGFLTDYPALVLIVSIIRNFAYWIIYNSISRQLMNEAPANQFSSIASGSHELLGVDAV